MRIGAVEEDFQRMVAEQIRLLREGEDRFRIFTPFMFDDGDLLALTLRKEQGSWVVTDEAHTYMQLSLDLGGDDIYNGVNRDIMARSLAMFQVEDRNGELIVEVQEDQFGAAMFSLVQAILRIVHVSAPVA